MNFVWGVWLSSQRGSGDRPSGGPLNEGMPTPTAPSLGKIPYFAPLGRTLPQTRRIGLGDEQTCQDLNSLTCASTQAGFGPAGAPFGVTEPETEGKSDLVIGWWSKSRRKCMETSFLTAPGTLHMKSPGVGTGGGRQPHMSLFFLIFHQTPPRRNSGPLARCRKVG